ncbi:exo-beta-N-acetylmuramidase NamZ domain-containing protein [Streptomyces sp. NBC_00212]|uniref:exo-beta-N-acetylmuramidase NamZ family protein n=1 Tax=Streptomyces sp. NBC_00212 TaxID=2975684 RepID=UPI003256290C
MLTSRRSFLATATAAGAAGAVTMLATGPAPAADAAPVGRGSDGAPGRVRPGFERLAADGYGLLAGQKVGALTNMSGVTRDMRGIVDVMHADPRVQLTAIFTGEHGYRGNPQAGKSEGDAVDKPTGLPIYDTYLKSGAALAGVLDKAGVDTVVYDFQDCGARFYTCNWTLYDAMVAAAMTRRRFVVLDRPNPVTGRRALGPVLHRDQASFVGREPIAQAHGMTTGELALLYNGEFLPRSAGRRVDLEVVRLDGWQRADFYDVTGLPWVPPSPNMATPDTALVYSGTCLFEGTNMSEGRGTTHPFEMLGAPGLDGSWAAAVSELVLPGVYFREAYYTPTFDKHHDREVGGLQIHVHDRTAYDPVRTGIALLVTAKQTYKDFAWLPDHYIDHLAGTDQVRHLIDKGASTEDVVSWWQDDLAAFTTVRANYLQYA